MYRLHDWECCACSTVHECLTDVPTGETPPRLSVQWCPVCEGDGQHERLISLVAEYHGERTLNPMVHGGSFDTMGKAPIPDLPDIPGSARGDTEDYRQLFATPEWKEARAAQRNVIRLNNEKKKRARALARGQQVNFRRDKCVGDPKVTA